jgi:cell shape-determining protein MreD
VLRYTLTTLLLLLLAILAQQFVPALTGFSNARILVVQLVFLCSAVTLDVPAMLLLAFIGGFLWDAQYAILPTGDAEAVPVDALRFGYSIVLFGGMGYLMHGIQPLFREGKWQFSALLCGISILLYLIAEYLLICFVRGGFHVTRHTVAQVGYTALLTMLLSPLVFWILFRLADLCNHTIRFDGMKNRRRRPTLT